MLLYASVFLYPLQWSLPRRVVNRAEKTPTGWRFPAAGLVRSPSTEQFRDGRFEVALRAKSARADQQGPARILTISNDSGLRNLSLGQVGDDLIVNVRAPGSWRTRKPQYWVPGVFTDSAWHEARLAVVGDTVELFVDGALRLRKVYAGPVMATWDRGYKVVLGNELTGRFPWLGEVQYAGKLERPERYWSVEHVPLLVPFRNIKVSDFVLNLLGFVPLGFLLVRLGWSRSAALFLSALLSLSIEVAQLGLVDRFASTTDLLLNTSGGLAGAFLTRRPRAPRLAPGSAVRTGQLP